MTRYSLAKVTEDTGVTVFDVQNRMVDFGVDAFWLSHEPWFVPEPFTPEPGELWSKEDVDYWIDVLEQIIAEAYEQPEVVKSAPHSQAVHQANATAVENPETRATTWRAYMAKSGQVAGLAGPR